MSFNSVRFHQISEVKGTVDLIDIVFAQGQLCHKKAQKLLVDSLFHFQADRVASLALLELLLDLLEQVFRLIFRDLQIRAPHDPVRTGALDLIIHEQPGQKSADDVFEEHKPSGLAFQSGKDKDPGENAGHLHSGEFILFFAAFARLLRFFAGTENTR